jgi:hypothetical protein
LLVTSNPLRSLAVIEGQVGGLAGRFGMLGQQVGLAAGAIAARAWLAAFSGLVPTVASPQLWRRALDAVLGATILGGVLGAPLAACAALVGLWLPAHAPLREIGGSLLGVAIVWFLLALLCAHLHAGHEKLQAPR